jgi:bifunctional non-homologous end joining protein LigD
MLPSRADEAFYSDAHIFEVRWAGIRALARVERARLQLISQSGREISPWFPELAGIAAQVSGDGVVLDGEIVALDVNGEPDLGQIAARLAGGPVGDGAICVYQAYDALYIRGAPLIDRPITERKDILAGLIGQPGPAIAVSFVPHDGTALFEAAAERRLPGIVAKAKASTYLPGQRSTDWVEVPVYESSVFVIGGYVLGLKGEAPVAALLLGEPVLPGRLHYVATVQAGPHASLLEPALNALATDANPFLITPDLLRLVYWLRPELVCEVRYARREADGRLRFPVLVTLRPDLSVKEVPAAAPAARAGLSP